MSYIVNLRGATYVLNNTIASLFGKGKELSGNTLTTWGVTGTGMIEYVLEFPRSVVSHLTFRDTEQECDCEGKYGQRAVREDSHSHRG